MPNRRILLVFGLTLGLLPAGCLTTGEKGLTSQKTREPATLPPAESADLCMAVADQMISTGHFPEAIHQLHHVRALNPKAEVSSRLARLYARIGKDDLALTEFEQAVKQAPKDAALWNDYGYFYYERGNWTEAEKKYRVALEQGADNQKIWMNLGLALGQSGKYQEALAAFEQSVKPAEARCNLAFVLGTQGKADEARRLYQEALQIDPSLKLARTALSKLEEGPKPPRAEKTEAAPQLQPRSTLPTPVQTAPQTTTSKLFEYPEP